MLHCGMPYKIPPDNECVELLTDAEFKLCPTERAAIARGRSKAWAEHLAYGPSGRLRDLACGSVSDSVLLAEYTRTGAISQIVAAVSLAESVQFKCRLERSLVDGSIIGVRVTLVAFTK